MKENTREDEVEIDLKELILLVVHKLWIVILVGSIAAVGCHYIMERRAVPYYEADTTIYILYHQDENKLLVSDMQTGDYLTSDYQGLIKSRSVLEKVIDELSLDITYKALSSRTTVTLQPDTRILTIAVQDEDPELAMKIANTVRTVSTDYINEIMRVEAVTEIDKAKFPEEPILPNINKNAAIAGIFAGILMIGLIVFIDLLSQKIKNVKEIESKLGMEVLAVIPDVNEKRLIRIHKKKLIQERKLYKKQIMRKETEYQTPHLGAVSNSIDKYEIINA
ncbi:MAG: Wzz/FepE/Etk N-terminal domain-containing protein [bacterium]|nr:Wzz/FepE/Etk N-terminal domain-containing protein [bacterium]